MALRLIRILATTEPASRPPRTEELLFRVLPWDCDLNLHVNNAEYLKFMDLGRLHLVMRAGMFGEIRRRRLMPVVSQVEIRYRRPLRPFQRFWLRTSIERTDPRAFHFRQVFHWKEAVYAEATVVGHLLHRGRPISPGDLVAVGAAAAPI